MKCYLLLRDNVESGPFDLEQLSTQKLVPTDLIWVEGSSRSWRFPAEIEELAHLVQHQLPQAYQKKEENKKSNVQTGKSIFVALPPQPAPETSLKGQKVNEEPELEIHLQQPLEKLKDQYEKRKRQPLFTANKKQNNLFWMAALFAGLLAGAFMIKKMVDTAGQHETNPIAAASLQANAFNRSEQKEADATYRNALTTEVVPVDTTTEIQKVVKKKVNLKRLVTLSASEFKKGVFGGINDLELKVKNRSELHLNKVNIEVTYLKPNGQVVKKENYSLTAVAPKSTKNLVIPPSKRGVDIKYRITNIQSEEAQASTRDI